MIEKLSNQVKKLYTNYPFPNDNPKIEELEKHKWILNSLPKPIKNPSKILDAGCGTGEMSCFLSYYAFSPISKITGIDFSENSIKKANKLKKKFNLENVEFRVDDLTNLKLKEKFDYIFCIGVLHHIPRVDLALENLKKLMHKDTFLVATIYNKYATFWKRFFYKREPNIAREMDTYHHPYKFYYTKKSAKRLFEKHNLKIIKIWRDIPEIIRLITGKGDLMSLCVKLK